MSEYDKDDEHRCGADHPTMPGNPCSLRPFHDEPHRSQDGRIVLRWADGLAGDPR